MLQQYLAAKEAHPDCIVLFRMGDFYEVFFEDAQTVASELELTLTARGKDRGEPIPMAGVPHHAAEGYIRRLVQRGYHVAICDQLEDPSASKGIVRRGVVRVITPGVHLDDVALEAGANNFLAAVAVSSVRSADVTAIATVDISTGELRVTEVTSVDALATELRRLAPAELVVAGSQTALFGSVLDAVDVPIARRPDHALELKRVTASLEQHALAVDTRGQATMSLSTYDVRERLAVLDEHAFRDRPAIEAALALALDYVRTTHGSIPATLDPPTVYRTDDFVVLDPASTANLEIFETLMGGRRKGSLFSVIDETVTAPGARRLRTWLTYPLTDRARIEHRQRAVTSLVARLAVRQRIREALRATADVQRVSTRLAAGQGSARDLVTLSTTLARVPDITAQLAELDETDALATIQASLDPCDDVRALIDAAVVDDPPIALNEGGIIRRGYDAELDELIELTTDGKSWLLRFEAAEKQATGIASLKVKHNRVFGYYIEITRANLESVPDHYIRKQTLANAERYFTPELKEFEEKIVHAEERRAALEYRLFETVRAAVVQELARLRSTAEQLAELDALSALAELSQRRGYCAPVLTDEPGIVIREGRHPVVETMVEGGRFVPNDVDLVDGQRLQLITGPNMAGKSTVIRQVALIALLAQIGSHVPAASAHIGIVDQIFSRVGASDNLARGQSTFMVEMAETAHILQRASHRSLIVLDEIGRGTATWDGLSIAWAVAEHLHDEVGALTLFATHYHELTELARVREHVANFNIAAREWNDEILFLHKLVEGPASRSYGIQVARLAGVPTPVVDRAREILANLEQPHYAEEQPALARHLDGDAPGAPPAPQLNLFAEAPPAPPPPSPVLTELAELPVERMTPIDALNTLHRLQQKARRAR